MTTLASLLEQAAQNEATKLEAGRANYEREQEARARAHTERVIERIDYFFGVKVPASQVNRGVVVLEGVIFDGSINAHESYRRDLGMRFPCPNGHPAISFRDRYSNRVDYAVLTDPAHTGYTNTQPLPSDVERRTNAAASLLIFQRAAKQYHAECPACRLDLPNKRARLAEWALRLTGTSAGVVLSEVIRGVNDDQLRRLLDAGTLPPA